MIVREPRLVACWSPYPFTGFANYRSLYLQTIHAYSHVILADCRAGHAKKIDQILWRADLILLFLPHTREILDGLFQETVLYQRNCLPILCGYQRFAEPTPQQLRILFRPGDCPVGLLPDMDTDVPAREIRDHEAMVQDTGRLIRMRIEAL